MNTVKAVTLVLAILAAPTMSAAMGCSYGQHKQAQSCAEGSALDSATGTCVPVTSS